MVIVSSKKTSFKLRPLSSSNFCKRSFLPWWNSSFVRKRWSKSSLSLLWNSWRSLSSSTGVSQGNRSETLLEVSSDTCVHAFCDKIQKAVNKVPICVRGGFTKRIKDYTASHLFPDICQKHFGKNSQPFFLLYLGKIRSFHLSIMLL